MDRAALRATVRGVTRGRMWLKQLSSLWGESKSATMAWSGSLAPRFVNDWVTAEIPCSTVPACREALAWSQATLCCMHTWAPPRRQRRYCRVTAVSVGSATRGEHMACLVPWLQFQPGENTVIAAVPARREVVSSQVMLRLPHLPEEKTRVPFRHLLGLLPASWLGPCLPWVQRTMCTVRHSEAGGVTNRMESDTHTYCYIIWKISTYVYLCVYYLFWKTKHLRSRV